MYRAECLAECGPEERGRSRDLQSWERLFAFGLGEKKQEKTKKNKTKNNLSHKPNGPSGPIPHWNYETGGCSCGFSKALLRAFFKENNIPTFDSPIHMQKETVQAAVRELDVMKGDPERGKLDDQLDDQR